jgi:hypothetical protein
MGSRVSAALLDDNNIPSIFLIILDIRNSSNFVSTLKTLSIYRLCLLYHSDSIRSFLHLNAILTFSSLVNLIRHNDDIYDEHK